MEDLQWKISHATDGVDFNNFYGEIRRTSRKSRELQLSPENLKKNRIF